MPVNPYHLFEEILLDVNEFTLSCINYFGYTYILHASFRDGRGVGRPLSKDLEKY